jgi:hypothetical protein
MSAGATCSFATNLPHEFMKCMMDGNAAVMLIDIENRDVSV